MPSLNNPIRDVALAPVRDARNRRISDAEIKAIISATEPIELPAFVRLQESDPAIGGDLGWTTRDVVELGIHGHGATPQESVWVGELTSSESIPLRTPPFGSTVASTTSRFRVRIEE